MPRDAPVTSAVRAATGWDSDMLFPRSDRGDPSSGDPARGVPVSSISEPIR
jgi:hypothetical protein